MPWYYAGPEAKPVGPISLEELHARRQQGAVKPETYIIEQSGQPIETLTWKKYQDIFPAAATLPPVPPPAVLPPAPPPPPPAPAPAPPQPHPLFPSAAPAGGAYPAYPPAARPTDPYYQNQNIRPTNGWCGWGFGFGIASLPLSLACGVGVFPALLSVILCLIGLTQVHKRREQSGQGLAIAGLLMSGVALLISLAFIFAMALPMIKAHELTVTEQTSTDSE